MTCGIKVKSTSYRRNIHDSIARYFSPICLRDSSASNLEVTILHLKKYLLVSQGSVLGAIVHSYLLYSRDKDKTVATFADFTSIIAVAETVEVTTEQRGKTKICG